MKAELVNGNLLDQPVEVIVNSWNRNIIPWWLLILQGVSGAIKKAGGTKPFKEVAKYGAIPLGEARETSAGSLSYSAIIHVAGINMFWMGAEYSVTRSVFSAMEIVNQHQYESVAFPLIGSGSGNRGKQWSLDLMNRSLSNVESDARVIFVQFDSKPNIERS